MSFRYVSLFSHGSGCSLSVQYILNVLQLSLAVAHNNSDSRHKWWKSHERIC